VEPHQFVPVLRRKARWNIGLIIGRDSRIASDDLDAAPLGKTTLRPAQDAGRFISIRARRRRDLC
jgi:hypothetical protein